mmetsp:Transcript_17247/g.19318  ORF Transcript_17247/g.19318 Transcript_17247/m.19318 type:complete len:91 (-) Transcript_17247:181-453(-)
MNGGDTLLYHDIYSYHAHFFFLSLFIILKSYNDSILLLFRLTLYSTTQRRKIHQQVKKEEEEDSIYSLYVSSYICETTLYCKAEDDNANG